MRLRSLLLAIVLLLAFGSAGAQQQPLAGTTFQYAGGPVTTFAASPTDWITIVGSATKTTTISRLSVCGIDASTAAVMYVAVIKRSTADAAGTSTPVTAVNLSGTPTSATASVNIYTANPTLGTAVGTLNVKPVNLSPSGAGCVFLDYGLHSPAGGPGPLVLGLSASQQVAINLMGQTLPTGTALTWSIETSEK